MAAALTAAAVSTAGETQRGRILHKAE
jgi:hypothetical protein